MKPVHTVRFEIDEYGITPVFTCFAQKGDPFCRLVCPEPAGCETAAECFRAGHERVDHGCCLFVEWMDADDGINAYHGDKSPARGGMIVPEWKRDTWWWHYPAPGDLYR